jgi:hypothetical protein
MIKLQLRAVSTPVGRQKRSKTPAEVRIVIAEIVARLLAASAADRSREPKFRPISGADRALRRRPPGSKLNAVPSALTRSPQP